jgi:RimJ/RimL family protein N-acetyltransferase
MDVSTPRRVEGPNLVLRLVEPDDADYIHGLRTDPDYNAHLSEVRGSADDQRAWIESYKAREASGLEFYYIIERQDGTPCGTVRLYSIDEDDSFTWGSWILDHNKPRKAALESAFLVYRIAFNFLGLREARFDVRRDNLHTLAFHRRFGATETGSDEQDVFFVYPANIYEETKEKYEEILEQEAKS